MKIARVSGTKVSTRASRECSTASSAARGRPGTVRSARVTGAPSAANIGVTIIKIMCCTMCTLNSTVSYAPNADIVASVAEPRPPIRKAALRRSGQWSPRRRSTASPVT